MKKLIVKNQKPAKPITVSGKVRWRDVNGNWHESDTKDIGNYEKSTQVTNSGTISSNHSVTLSKKQAKRQADKTTRDQKKILEEKKKSDVKLLPRQIAKKGFSQNIANLQQLLYDMHYFGDLSHDKAVDGLNGKLTQEAIAKAQADGYEYHPLTGITMKNLASLEPFPFTSSSILPTFTPEQEKKMREQALAKVASGQYQDNTEDEESEDLPWYSRAWDATKEGIHSVVTWPERQFFEHAYPFGYDNSKTTSDVSSTLKEWNSYLPEWMQVSNDKIDSFGLGVGFVTKAVRGVSGNDKAGDAAHEFARLDLNTPEGKKRAKELVTIMRQDEPRWGVNFSDLNRALYVIRGRIDQNHLHTGDEQEFNTYTVNDRYNANGADKTYVLADEKARQRELDFMNSYLKSHPKNYTLSEDGKSRIYSIEGGDPYAQHGNYSIVTDLDGLNARYYDNWNYGPSESFPGMQTVIVGDKNK